MGIFSRLATTAATLFVLGCNDTSDAKLKIHEIDLMTKTIREHKSIEIDADFNTLNRKLSHTDRAYVLACSYMNVRAFDNALLVLAEEGYESHEILRLKSMIHVELGEFDEALMSLEDLQQISSSLHNEVEAIWMLTKISPTSGLKGAIELRQRLRGLKLRDPLKESLLLRLMFIKTEAEIALGRLSDALESLSSVNATNLYCDELFKMGKLYAELQAHEMSQIYLEKACFCAMEQMKNEPRNNAYLMFVCGRARKMMGATDEAIQMFEQSLDLPFMTEELKYKAMLELIEIHQARNDEDQIKKCLERGLHLFPFDDLMNELNKNVSGIGTASSPVGDNE